ncbi:hypothetical protein HF086_016155 [Spodoptera exigua]|uniref:Coiled-coil domain-containing protein 93 n=1 Tax=Spodoptera exigua TaxID=7107 RepID=A0A922MI60_SPOEX|nr:hypothetical protein HF086_016155 [Spodoptera exigua]
MATKQKNIFTRSKPLMNIYSGVDHEGKEVEVREDAEQLVKWHEISDALVAAGYYRAQLQGLSAFDKIVGGLTWCIELCDIDVDISLLFEENLTIGKKIALTEKIVKVLPSMKCPHTIEPHQIQGLDFINIYPLILWLIKYSSEFREAKEDELRKFAVMQYDKCHIFETDRAVFVQKEKLLRNLAVIQNLYKPCRVRKRKGGLPANELEQANRYVKDQDSKGTDADTKIHYAVLHSELTGEVSKELEEREKHKYSEDVDKLTKNIDVLEKEIQAFKETHQGRMENTKKQYANVLAKMQKITNKLMKTDGFRAAKDPEAKIDDKPLSPAELKEFNEREEKLKAFITAMRLELAKLNREVLRYSTAIDEVPVASKHKETKQYYIFYNTLLEVKLYTSKELSLLNSILDNYEEAMSSVRKREEFMSQFESIVDWVNHTVRKVEEKFKNEKERKNDLYNEYSRLMDVQRQYAAALKKLGEQRQRIDTEKHS